jgi:hypothetical protein
VYLLGDFTILETGVNSMGQAVRLGRALVRGLVRYRGTSLIRNRLS